MRLGLSYNGANIAAYQFSDGYVDVMGTIKGAPTPPNQVVLSSPDTVDPDLVDLVDFVPAAQRYSIDGFPATHVAIDAEIQSIL